MSDFQWFAQEFPEVYGMLGGSSHQAPTREQISIFIDQNITVLDERTHNACLDLWDQVQQFEYMRMIEKVKKICQDPCSMKIGHIDLLCQIAEEAGVPTEVVKHTPVPDLCKFLLSCFENDGTGRVVIIPYGHQQGQEHAYSSQQGQQTQQKGIFSGQGIMDTINGIFGKRSW